MFEKILFAIDRSIETSHAFSLAVSLAQKYGSSVTLLCVADTSELDESAADKQRREGQGLLEQAEAALHKAGIVQVKTEYREGKVAFAICDTADDLGTDLVIIGSRGVGLTEDGREDSVSNRVINLSPCPVLVVP
ncbi:MAG: universal stress protein [Cyanobacteria bacterium J06648_11]